MSTKNKTLLGFIGETCKEIREQQEKANNAPIATTADVEEIVRTMVNETFINSVSAKVDDPSTELIILEGEEFFFANGTPVVVKERPDGEEGCLITWDGGEILAGPTLNLFGGRHDDETLTNTSITIEGGYVKHVFGGGLHKSHTVKAVVKMTGGKCRNIRGGGADRWINTCTCSSVKYDGDIDNTWNIVEDITMELTGGTCENLVYGGGNGYSYAKSLSMIIDGDFVAETYVTVGGSNGHEGTGVLVVNGGNINILQGINRGTMNTIDMVINGGTINKLFAGGEIPFAGSPEKPNTSTDASGTFKKCTLTINGGEIAEVSRGGNNYLVVEEDDPAVVINDLR